MSPTIVSYLQQFDALKGFFNFTGELAPWIIYGVAAVIIAKVMALIGGLGTYAERKISADLQMRQGPNRVGPYGILQFLADGIKMMTKEDIAPKDSDKFLFYLAPLLCMVGVFATLGIVPFSSGFALTHLNVGVFFISAVASIVGLGIFLGGYASNSKWSLYGGMRGASQIISYEIPIGISALSVVTLAGSLNFKYIVEAQTGMPGGWFLFHNPFTFIGFFIMFVSGLAETNRAPFDLPEAESELVSGYHTEYTGMRFGFFALAEYIEIFVMAAITVALFLGGYNVPFAVGKDGLLIQFLQLGSFFTKTLLLYYVVIWVRWTLPRLRVDHLMTMCWKYLTPIAIFNLVGVILWVYFFDGKSMLDLLAALAPQGGGGH